MVVYGDGYCCGIVRPASEMMVVHQCTFIPSTLALGAYRWIATRNQSRWSIFATRTMGTGTDIPSSDSLTAINSGGIARRRFA